MKKILITFSLLLITFTLFAKKAKKVTDRWPDGTEMSAFFSDTTRVDLETLGKKYVITDYGVKNDSTVVQTAQIQAVIDRCAKEGGGVIVIPQGTFLSGSLFFKQGTNLQILGKLKGSDRICDFKLLKTRMEGQTLQYFAALVNADGLDGFCISGTLNHLSPLTSQLSAGTLDGNGYNYWQEFWYRRMYNKKCTNLEAMRPRLVYLSNCKNVTVQDVRIQNSPFWTNHLYRCEKVRYLGDYIYAPTSGVMAPGDVKEHGAPSSDALDIDVCHDVLVYGCYMNVNDDAVVLKGGKGTFADKDPDNGPSYNILVTNCEYGTVHGCLTCGSESLHDWNVVIRNIKLGNANRVLWLKMRPDTPQQYEKIRVENINGHCSSFLVVRPWTQFFVAEKRDDMPASYCSDITIKNINVTSDNFFDVGKSDKYSLRSFTFDNVKAIDKKCAFPSTGSGQVPIIENCTVKNVNISKSGDKGGKLLDSVSGNE